MKALYAFYKNEVSQNGISMAFPKFAQNKAANAKMLLLLKYHKYPQGVPSDESESESDWEEESESEDEDE